MFFTRALRSSATIAINHAAQTSAKTAAKSGRHIGEAWAVTEVKRLVPTLGLYATFIATVLGWPLLYRKVDLGIGINGKEQATTARRVLNPSGHHFGESWAKSETKRLTPTIMLYGVFLSSVVAWPYWVREYESITHGRPNWAP
ncbi:hypothetical protein C6P43_000379 [Kluyveromyces marxianus]|nr:hypothetical protein C6P43_000379 [Kluyveromyces marxianus]